MRTRAHLAVLFTNIFFATNYSLIKHISPSRILPLALNVYRVAVSLVLLWILWTMGKTEPGIRKEDRWRFFLCGLTGVAINQTFFMKGLTLTSTIHASLLMLSTPLLITIFAAWFLKERITLLKLLGIASGITGSVMLVTGKVTEAAGENFLLGDIFILLNAISYTFYFILVKPLMEKYPPVHVIRWVFTIGFVLILPFGWQQSTEVKWSMFEWSHILSMAYIIICGTFLAYYFNVFGIQHLGAGVAGSYIYTQPIFAATIAVLFLGEEFTVPKVIAGLLIFAGVFLVSRRTN